MSSPPGVPLLPPPPPSVRVDSLELRTSGVLPSREKRTSRPLPAAHRTRHRDHPHTRSHRRANERTTSASELTQARQAEGAGGGGLTGSGVRPESETSWATAPEPHGQKGKERAKSDGRHTVGGPGRWDGADAGGWVGRFGVLISLSLLLLLLLLAPAGSDPCRSRSSILRPSV